MNIFYYSNRNFTEHYKTEVWWANGPVLVTDVIAQICRTRNFTHTKPKLCWGLKIYQPSAFYPILHTHWDDFFETDKKKLKKLEEMVKDSIAIHFNNLVSHKVKILKSKPTNIYRMLAEKNCPKVMKASGNEF